MDVPTYFLVLTEAQFLTGNTIYTDYQAIGICSVNEKTRYTPARQERKLSNYIERHNDHFVSMQDVKTLGLFRCFHYLVTAPQL